MSTRLKAYEKDLNDDTLLLITSSNTLKWFIETCVDIINIHNILTSHRRDHGIKHVFLSHKLCS